MFRSTAIVVVCFLLLTGNDKLLYAFDLPACGTTLFASPSFKPLTLNGLILDPSDPLRFSFLVDEGDTKLSQSELKQQTQVMLNYFLAALAMPEKDIWVNLSPYEANRIIPDKLATTDMGRDMLGQDYILKQLAASLTHPDTEAGRKYWDALNNYKLHITDYKLNSSLRGSEATKQSCKIATPSARDDMVNTLQKVWIIPDRAVVYQGKDRVYVGESHLKVMTQEDYLAQQANSKNSTNSINSFKANIIPLIEKEVNTGKNFATLRQIFNAIILSIWFKKALKQSILYQNYADKKNTAGIADIPQSEKMDIYNRYLESIQKGAYNLVKTTGGENMVSPLRKITKRHYFSGGVAVPGAFVDSGIETKEIKDMPEPAGSQHEVTADVVESGESEPSPQIPVLSVPSMQDIMSDRFNEYTFWNGKEVVTQTIPGVKALFDMPEEERVRIIAGLFEQSTWNSFARDSDYGNAWREWLVKGIAKNPDTYKELVVYGVLLRMFRKDSSTALVKDLEVTVVKHKNFLNLIALPGFVGTIGASAMYYYGQSHFPWMQSHPQLSSYIYFGVMGISAIAALVLHQRDIVRLRVDQKVKDILVDYVFRGVLHPLAVDYRILEGENIDKYAHWAADNLLNVSDEETITRMLEYKKGKLNEIQIRYIVRSINDKRMPQAKKTKDDDSDQSSGQGPASGGGVKPHTGGIEIDEKNLDLSVKGEDIRFDVNSSSRKQIDFKNIVLNIADIRRVESVKRLLTLE